MRNLTTQFFIIAFVAALAGGCGSKPESKPSETAPLSESNKPVNIPPAPEIKDSDPKVFFVRGIVKGLLLQESKVIVDHEEIPDFMAAMTMPFNLDDTNDFTGITTNDRIHFRLVVEKGRSWIDQIRKTGSASLTNALRKTFRLVREVEPLSEGDMLPNYPFTNHLGQAFQTKEFKGKATAITLIFTRCPLPDFCPRMSANFNRAYHLLKNDQSAPTNWHLMTLSFDPEFDTPSVLKSYSARFEADPKKWSFATGALIEIDDLTERFGMYFAREETGVTFNHNLRTIVLDPQGKIQKIFIGNTWKPEELVAEMKEAAVITPQPEKQKSSAK